MKRYPHKSYPLGGIRSYAAMAALASMFPHPMSLAYDEMRGEPEEPLRGRTRIGDQLYTEDGLRAEYELIQQKESRLSASQRAEVVRVVERDY